MAEETNPNVLILYHFTSVRHLRPIAKYGLTVGDIPTNLAKGEGRIGVWLTSSPLPEGHGLERGVSNKKAYRLAVAVNKAGPLLHRWNEWSKIHVTRDTLVALHKAASADGVGGGPDTWFIYLGVLPASSIVECVRVETGEVVVKECRKVRMAIRKEQR